MKDAICVRATNAKQQRTLRRLIAATAARNKFSVVDSNNYGKKMLLLEHQQRRKPLIIFNYFTFLHYKVNIFDRINIFKRIIFKSNNVCPIIFFNDTPSFFYA